jgi:hypothetical protein
MVPDLGLGRWPTLLWLSLATLLAMATGFSAPAVAPALTPAWNLDLNNGTSYITFTGESAFGGDPQACVDSFVALHTADPNVSNLSLADQGSTEATGSYAIYTHDYQFSDRKEPYTLFVGCILLIPNEAVLAVVQNVPTAQYDEQVTLREALLRGLTLNQ